MNFFIFLFFVLHLTLGEKLDICERDDLFFALHLTLGEKRTALNSAPFSNSRERPCVPIAMY